MRKFIAVGFLFYIWMLLLTTNAQISSIPTRSTISQAYQTVADEGSNLTQRNKLNFIGSTVSCVDNSGATRTDCTITSGAGVFQSIITDFTPSLTATPGTVLNIAAGRCWGASKSAATATITAGSGNGSYVVYCTDSQTLVVEDATAAGLTITCTNCTRIQTATPQVPEGLYPVATGTITTGQWTAVTDTRDFTTRFTFQNGLGMATTVVGSVVTNQVDPVTVQMTANDYNVVNRLDASGAISTAPNKTGTSLPGTCAVGDTYFKSDATAGSNNYGCTAPNVWTLQGGGTITATSSSPYYPFGAFLGTTSDARTVTANEQRVWTFTPSSTFTVSKFRFQYNGAVGYTAFAVTDFAGTTILPNASGRCNHATGPGSGNSFECSLAGSVTLTIGTPYRLVITGDAATGYYGMGNSVLEWNGAVNEGMVYGGTRAIGIAANPATGSGATLAVAVPLGTINAPTFTSTQYPVFVFIP